MVSTEEQIASWMRAGRAVLTRRVDDGETLARVWPERVCPSADWAAAAGLPTCECRDAPATCGCGDRRIAGHPWYWAVPQSWCLARALVLADALRAAEYWGALFPAVGLRCWRIADGRLMSWVMDYIWPGPRVGPAVVSPRGEGFHALKPASWRKLAVPGGAVGIVTLHGKVMQHRFGYRGEYARIREVWLLGDAPICDESYPGVRFHRLEVQ
jgi:hypothetical protein